jgi:hypothetical protein
MKTSVSIVVGSTLALSLQKMAVSVSQRSIATIHFSFSMALRSWEQFGPPTAGF